MEPTVGSNCKFTERPAIIHAKKKQKVSHFFQVHGVEEEEENKIGWHAPMHVLA